MSRPYVPGEIGSSGRTRPAFQEKIEEEEGNPQERGRQPSGQNKGILFRQLGLGVRAAGVGPPSSPGG